MTMNHPISIDNEEELKKYLENFIYSRDFCLMVIDGIDDAGKSFLGKKLSELLKVEWLDIDLFLEKNQGTFINAIKYGELKNTVNEKLSKNNLIICGICALEVLKRIDTNCDILIYVKKMNRYGKEKFWENEDFNSTEDPRDKIKRIYISLENEEYDEKNHQIEIEVREYHIKYKPHMKADIIFERFTN